MLYSASTEEQGYQKKPEKELQLYALVNGVYWESSVVIKTLCNKLMQSFNFRILTPCTEYFSKNLIIRMKQYAWPYMCKTGLSMAIISSTEYGCINHAYVSFHYFVYLLNFYVCLCKSQLEMVATDKAKHWPFP